MSKLHISDSLSLPIDAVTQKFGMLGRTGSGKSYAATKLAEEMLDAKAQIVAIDPVGVWYGLRTGFSIPVFGGLHGDIPLEVGGGALIADLLVDRGLSAVIDVSQFESDADKARFAKDFAARFFFRKKASPSAVHIFIEEAQEFVPQNPGREEGKMLHAFGRMAKLGRNFGIGMTLITQRPQEVNKKALNQTECLFAFQMTGPQERKTIQGWIAEKGVEEDIDAELPHLKVGQARVWSPQWLEISKTIKISAKKTADVSSTPKHGERKIKAKDLRPVDLERAKADDPVALRKEVVALRGQITNLERQTSKAVRTETRTERKEIPVLKDGQLNKLLNYIGCVAKHLRDAKSIVTRDFEKTITRIESIEPLLKPISDALAKLVDANMQKDSHTRITPSAMDLAHGRRTPVEISRPEPAKIARPAVRAAAKVEHAAPDFHGSGEKVSGPQQRILGTLAMFETLGVVAMNKDQLALLSGASPASSSYANNVGGLRGAGLVEYPQPGLVALTNDGRLAEYQTTQFTTQAELRRFVYNLVGPARARILEVLIEKYPDAVGNDELAEAAGASPTSSSFANNRGSLRSLRLIDYPRPGFAVANEILFPPLPK